MRTPKFCRPSPSSNLAWQLQDYQRPRLELSQVLTKASARHSILAVLALISTEPPPRCGNECLGLVRTGADPDHPNSMRNGTQIATSWRLSPNLRRPGERCVTAAPGAALVATGSCSIRKDKEGKMKARRRLTFTLFPILMCSILIGSSAWAAPATNTPNASGCIPSSSSLAYANYEDGAQLSASITYRCSSAAPGDQVFVNGGIQNNSGQYIRLLYSNDPTGQSQANTASCTNGPSWVTNWSCTVYLAARPLAGYQGAAAL